MPGLGVTLYSFARYIEPTSAWFPSTISGCASLPGDQILPRARPARRDNGKSKVNQAIDAMIAAYHATAERQYFTDDEPDPLRGSSIVLFSDIGLGEDAAEKRGFDMRAWIERRLAAAGIPSGHVAFMHDDDEARARAMERIKAFNARPYARGSIRISQETLIQSVRTRRANDAKRHDGVLIENRALDRHLRGMMPERTYQ